MPGFLQLLLGFLLLDLACLAGLILLAALAYRRRLRAPQEADGEDGSELRQLLGCAGAALLLLAAAYGCLYLAWRLW